MDEPNIATTCPIRGIKIKEKTKQEKKEMEHLQRLRKLHEESLKHYQR